MVIIAFSLGPSAAAGESVSGLLGPAHDIEAIEGPGVCAECHEKTAQIWELTLHHTLMKQTHRSKEGRAIAARMGIKRIKDPENLCVSCHYTIKTGKKRPKAIAGVSCESCHGAARDWNKVHSEYSGKEKETESPEEAEARWAKSEAAGMIRPRNLYALAGNCYSCHATAHEKLIDVGEHPTGKKFELLSWAMGEVRHNVWYTEQNDEASPGRKRMLYLAGLALSLETSLRALARVEEPDGKYAGDMRARADSAKERLEMSAGRLAGVQELRAMIDAARPEATSAEELVASAAQVGEQARLLLRRDGSGMEAMDDLLPGPDAYVGDVANP